MTIEILNETDKSESSKSGPRIAPGRYLIIALVGAVALSTVTLFLYFRQFDGVFSTSQQEWGAFGDYVGGTLNPILAFLNLVLIGLSLRQSAIALRHSVEANQSVQEDQRRQRLYDFVFRFETEIAAHQLPRPIPKHSGAENPRPPDEFRCIQSANMFRLLHRLLSRLSKLDGEDPLVFHLCEKHGGTVRKLSNAGWLGAVGDRQGAVVAFFDKYRAMSLLSE